MWWRDHHGWSMVHDGYSGWWLMLLLAVALTVGVALIALLVALALRGDRPAPGRLHAAPSQEALETLRRRYAAGEIDDDEFGRRVRFLDQPPH